MIDDNDNIFFMNKLKQEKIIKLSNDVSEYDTDDELSNIIKLHSEISKLNSNISEYNINDESLLMHDKFLIACINY